MTSSLEKTRRQRAIRQIVDSASVASQDNLVDLLRVQGFQVTQSTLSRDLREMKVLRIPTAAGYVYQSPGTSLPTEQSPHLQQVAAEEVVGLEANETTVVIRTLSGRASGVAAFLDSWSNTDLMATVAGDDAVLALPASTRHTPRLLHALEELFSLRPVFTEEETS